MWFNHSARYNAMIRDQELIEMPAEWHEEQRRLRREKIKHIVAAFPPVHANSDAHKARRASDV